MGSWHKGKSKGKSSARALRESQAEYYGADGIALDEVSPTRARPRAHSQGKGLGKKKGFKAGGSGGRSRVVVEKGPDWQ